jgi:hypothetical protein
MSDVTLNVSQYFGEDRFFRIPAYQRGYKWGVPNKRGESDVDILVDDFIKAKTDETPEYFLQGVTVYEEGNTIILIDGQQRTTTLFLILHELQPEMSKKHLFWNGKFKLSYEIREDSHRYLEDVCSGNEPAQMPDLQDIFYFNSARQVIRSKTLNMDAEAKADLANYILEKVKLFYIIIDKGQASKIFSMLNGAKAFMKTDELVKAELLSKISSADSETDKSGNDLVRDLKVVELRSKFARQWDKWLYWWKRDDVKAFFKSHGNPMGLLLEYYCLMERKKGIAYSNSPENVGSVFKAFQNAFLKTPNDARTTFEKLRKLQKRFEDIYNIPAIYNHLGLALIVSGEKDTIQYFLSHYKDVAAIRRYSLLRLADVTHDDIQKNENDIIIDRIKELSTAINSKDVYNNDENKKEQANRQLFRLNVEAANTQQIKFEFFYHTPKGLLDSLYGNRSLEHVFPKSRFYYVDLEKKIRRRTDNNEITELDSDMVDSAGFDAEDSEHCIGNLLFLHKAENSQFRDATPKRKKEIYFDLNVEFHSRNLLHTMTVFAHDEWTSKDATRLIHGNKTRTFNRIMEGYSNVK